MGKTKARSRRTRRRAMAYEDVIGISQRGGSYSNITISTLTGLPQRMNFRPIWMEFRGVGGYVPGTLTRPGYYAPAAVQMWFSEGDNARSTTSQVIEMSSTPRTVRIYYPRSGDWYSSEADKSAQLAGFEAICPGPPSDAKEDFYVRGHIRMRIQLSPEVYPATCPTRATYECNGILSQPQHSASCSSIELVGVPPGDTR